MASTSKYIPTQGILGQGLWQAVRGKLFKGAPPAPGGYPVYAVLSINQRVVIPNIITRTVENIAISRNVTLEVIE